MEEEPMRRTMEELRPVRIYRVPDGNLWITENMGFYKSSGNGNDEYLRLYQDTWMPFYGRQETTGTIVKHSTLVQEELPLNGKRTKHQYLPWHMKLCNLIFHNGEIINIVDDIYKTPTEPYIIQLFSDFNFIGTENQDLLVFLTSYFSTWWQLQISASIGGGFWENERFVGLREFVLTHKMTQISNSLEVIIEPEESSFILNEVIMTRSEYWDDINYILQEEHAIIYPLLQYHIINSDLNNYLLSEIQTIKNKFTEKIRMIKTLERRRIDDLKRNKGKGKKHTTKIRKSYNSKTISLGNLKSKRRKRRYISRTKR
jgi:hypothetical protein